MFNSESHNTVSIVNRTKSKYLLSGMALAVISTKYFQDTVCILKYTSSKLKLKYFKIYKYFYKHKQCKNTKYLRLQRLKKYKYSNIQYVKTYK